jgi:hypothetical protein
MTPIYNSYFNKLPKIKYDMNHSVINPQYETVTNIFFRIRVIKEVLNNINSYFAVEIEDGETPEIIAEKVYGDSGAGWLVLITNQIIDPQFEWPLDYDSFNKYIIGKYGSIENAETTYHHYEKVVTRELQPDNVTTVTRFVVNKEKLTDNNLSVPYNYYEIHGVDPGSLANVQSVDTFNINGKTVTETTKGEAITNYAYEESLNDDRRIIKIIKKEYYEQIINQFNELTGSYASFRRVVR